MIENSPLPPATGALNPAIVLRSHAALLRHTDLQFDFPALQAIKPPAWLAELQKFLEAAAPFLKWVFWIAAALAATAILYLLLREAWRLRRPALTKTAERGAAMAEWRPTPQQARMLLTDADALAAQERFAEAVHLLLLRSIQDIDLFRPRVVQRAFTSREIQHLDVLPPSLRNAFSEIMRVVESSFFGGLPVNSSDFMRCRSDYEQFALPDAWNRGHIK